MWMYELAIIEYLSEQEKLIGEQENFMMPYYEKVMNQLKRSRKKQGQKFWNQTVETQCKNYLKDWVANFEIVDYLEKIS